MPIGLTWASASDSDGKKEGRALGRSAFGERCLVCMCEDQRRMAETFRSGYAIRLA